MKDEEIAGAVEELAKLLTAAARRLRKEPTGLAANAELAEVDRALLDLHHRIGHALGGALAGEVPAGTAQGEIKLDELTSLLYRTINPPESRRNYTYTPPFSIERVLKAYLSWIDGPGRGVNVRG